MRHPRLTRVLALGFMVLWLAALQPSLWAGGVVADCAALAALALPDVAVTEAVAVPAATTGPVRVAHCRVNGAIEKDIRFSLLLPEQWNRKFVMGGGGGFVGAIDNQARGSVNSGFATVGTDTGHQASITTARWAYNDLERQINFGSRAVHRVVEVSKSIVRTHYGAAASRSYFAGCSNGGRQALMSAQRYPDDFDGIVAGAPAYDFTAIAAQFIKDSQAAYPGPNSLQSPPFTAETLTSIESQIVATCDTLDGVEDGVMEDPRACTVDVAALTGLTDAQKTTLRTIYGDTRNRDGVIFPGQPVGGEGDAAGWAPWIVGPSPLLKAQNAPSLRYAFGTEVFKYFIFNDPEWDYRRYAFDNFARESAQAGRILNATNADLSAFKARGRKLILWHGWSDPALTALGTIKYYEQVQARDPQVRDYARLFMMPGVLHCAGGPGPDQVDWPAAIDAWVESGQPPARLVAGKVAANGTRSRTRPLCPYPQRAVYSGTGGTDDEKSFVCT